MLRNLLSAVRELHGEEPVQRCARRLEPHHRAEFDAGILPGRWYDDAMVARVCLALHEQLGEQEMYRLGVAMVQHHVGRAQRFLVRAVGPARLLRRADGLWRYWRDRGRVAVERLEADQARVAILDYPVMAGTGYAPLYCAGAAFAVALSGARDLRLEVQIPSPNRIVAELCWAPNREERPRSCSIDRIVASLAKQRSA